MDIEDELEECDLCGLPHTECECEEECTVCGARLHDCFCCEDPE